MQILESRIERQVAREAERLGVRVIKLANVGETGWPDRLVVLPDGKTLFIEFKRPGCKLRPKQTYIHGVLASLGQNVAVMDNVEDAINLIKTFLKD